MPPVPRGTGAMESVRKGRGGCPKGGRDELFQPVVCWKEILRELSVYRAGKNEGFDNPPLKNDDDRK